MHNAVALCVGAMECRTQRTKRHTHTLYEAAGFSTPVNGSGDQHPARTNSLNLKSIAQPHDSPYAYAIR